MNGLFAAGTFADYFQGKQVPILGYEISEGWALAMAAFLHAFILANFFGVVPLFFIWMERKVSGRIQDRLGPTRVGGRFGWLQTVADGLKLLQKEDLCPTAADRLLFRMSPYIACAASFGAFMVLPFADGWVAVASDIALFLLFGILSLEVVGIILAGYSSGSKWSLFGGMRESAQMVSYEIPLAIAGLIPVVAVGSLNLNEIGNLQSGWGFPHWLIFHDPFTFIAFFIFFTVATASCKRAPFDLAEAESELVGGFHTEYSGMRWSFFFMAEYATMFLVSAVGAILFLGAWNTGIGPLDASLARMQAAGTAIEGFSAQQYFANVIGLTVLVTKGVGLVFVQMWLRWTLPRLRIDQVMMTCLKYLIPISCVLFLGVTLWPLILSYATGRTHWYKPLGDRFVRPPAVSKAERGEPRAESRRPSSQKPDVALRTPEGGQP